MATTVLQPGSRVFLSRGDLPSMIQRLGREGYMVLAPTVRDGVVTLAKITSADELPNGVRDQQKPGHYTLKNSDPELCFEYVVGPDGPKRWFFPPIQRLGQFHIDGDQFVIDAGPPQPPKLALLGIRPCELAAIKIQDRVFGMENSGQTFRCEMEPYYQETRRQSLLITVNCTRPGGNCFCASMGTGPQSTGGHDLALTELHAGYVIDIGTPAGAKLAASLPVREPSSSELELAELKLEQARDHMGRTLDPKTAADVVLKQIDDPHWNDVAQRCLSCGNCTMVCPTCFCSTVSDQTDLSGAHITRYRQWESCFTHQFSNTTAGPIRNTIRGRYRHWLRHKLGTWWEQFGSSGCVGCGRCITWCPVGIDLTAEIADLAETHAPDEPPAPAFRSVRVAGGKEKSR